MLLEVAFVLVSLVSLACIVLVIWQARAFFAREDTWRRRDQELRDQMWVMAGGKKPSVVFEREKIIKIPDPEAAPQPMTSWDAAIFNDEVKETLEQIHPEAAGMAVSQVKARWPQEWQAIEARIREERRPLRAG